MKEPAIVFKDFSFQYKVQHEPTLHDINLTIYKGEKVLILGSSGSGKSTLANCINGLIPFSHHGTMTGSVTVMGQETRESSIYGLSKTVGTVLQDSDAQFVGLSVAEDIAFAMENEAKPRREMVPIVEEHAATVGMSDFLGAVPFNLSGGQKRRAAIAGIMAMEPEVLVLDEPAAGLDPVGREEILGGIASYQRNRGITVIIVSHSMEDMARYADRLVVMNQGRIFMQGSCAEVFADPEKLTDIGLGIPQITRFMLALKKRGIDVRTDIFTVEQAKNEILRISGRSRHA